MRATYSATLLSCRPIHFAILIGPALLPSMRIPTPDGPGFPSEPPSTYATRFNIYAGITMRDYFFSVKGFLDSRSATIHLGPTEHL